MKKTLLLISFFSLYIYSFSQLERIAPVTSKVYNTSKVSGLNILLNTKDFNNFATPNQPNIYPSSIQMVHIEQPFPPIWYIVGENKSVNATFNESDFLFDFNLQEAIDGVSFGALFYNGAGIPVIGYYTFDSTTINVIDTTLDRFAYTLDSARNTVDLHDFRYNSNKEKLLMANVNKTIDGRCLTNNEADSNMLAVVTYIVVLDSNNNPILIWNPLEHLSPCEMYYEYSTSSTSYGGRLNWSHGNSVRWANDGNIIYSFRHIGCGKINYATGDIMWKLGGKDTANAISVADSNMYFLQHDFHQLPNGLYSVFSNGDINHLFMEGILYDINETNNTANVVYRYRPTPDCISLALGSVDYINDLCILNRGAFLCTLENKINEIVDTATQTVVAELFGPTYQFSYQSRGTYWNVSHRPNIKVENGLLKTDSIADLSNYQWYLVTDSTATLVGNGLSITPSTGKYVVQAEKKYGNFVVSKLLSDVIEIDLTTKINNNLKTDINIYFDGLNNIINISKIKENGLLQIYNINGQIINQQEINQDMIIPVNVPKGVYIVSYKTNNYIVSKKLYIK